MMRVIAFATVFFNSCVAKVSSFFASSAKKACLALTEQHLEAAKLCRDVYFEDIETRDEFVESKDTGAQATVTQDGSQAVVCFRGSDDALDWKQNLKVCKVPFLSRKHKDPSREVHSGFFIGHNSIKSKVYSKLNAIVDSGTCESIVFIGHSAGAALAKLSAFDYVNDNKLPLTVTSFGCPKIGNTDFASAFESDVDCTRIVNDNDVIALMPMFNGYRHVGDLIQMKHLDQDDKDKNMFMRILVSAVNIARMDLVHDHSMNGYVAAVEHYVKKNK